MNYINFKITLNDNFHLLIIWFKGNKYAFPRLFKVATFIHSIPATSATSKRVFSQAGNVITDKRSRLNAVIVNDLLFLNGNVDFFDECSNVQIEFSFFN